MPASLASGRPASFTSSGKHALAVGFKLMVDSVECVATDLATNPVAAMRVGLAGHDPDDVADLLAGTVPVGEMAGRPEGGGHGTTPSADYSNRNASLLFVNLDSCCNRPSRRSPAKSRYSGGTTNSRSRSGFDDLRKVRFLTIPGIDAEKR